MSLFRKLKYAIGCVDRPTPPIIVQRLYCLILPSQVTSIEKIAATNR